MHTLAGNRALPTKSRDSDLAKKQSKGMTRQRPQRILRLTLGVFWVIAGLLQAQPDMFTTDFYANYPPKIMESLLQSVADGQPDWLANAVHFGMAVWAHHPILYNVGAILIQVGIGVVLIFGPSKRWQRTGLWVSIIWGTLVWVFGEGMGGLFTGSTFFDGWPGAVLLYVLGAAMLLAPDRLWQGNQMQRILRWSLVVFWLVMAVIQALPSSGFWQSGGLMSQFANAGSLPQPEFLAIPIQSFSLITLHQPVLWNAVFVGIMILLSLGYMIVPRRRWLMIVALLWLFWSWWFGQDFGAIFSGMGTDVNSLPLLMLYTVVYWTLARPLNNKPEA